MIRINLLRDRRAERFAEALVGNDALSIADIRKNMQEARSQWFADMLDSTMYSMLVTPEHFKQIKEMPMSKGEVGIWQGIRIIPSKHTE